MPEKLQVGLLGMFLVSTEATCQLTAAWDFELFWMAVPMTHKDCVAISGEDDVVRASIGSHILRTSISAYWYIDVVSHIR